VPSTPDDIATAARALRASVSQILDKKGLTLKTCGTNTKPQDLKPFDPQTGYWQDPADVTNKPPRWIVHVAVHAGQVVASVPPIAGSDRLGYYNLSSGDVGGVFVRVIPAIRRSDGAYVLHHAWEWILFFGFREPLKAGTSSELLQGFNPATGAFQYKGANQPYAVATLFALSEPGDQYVWGEGQGQAITYEQATQAVRTLLNVAAQQASKTAKPNA
jgi:5-methylcytosine-specific restriction enzyme B